jgi:BirA family biotin operon repressor/biotin-[acetyl-CoA-carboxylase] ligase
MNIDRGEKARMLSHRENSCHDQFSPAELERLVAETFVEHLDYHEQIGSTNDRALELADSDDARFPLLVLAGSQTAGRGRGTNHWWSGHGALTFSVLLATESAQLPVERWPQVALTVGLAVCETLEALIARGVPTAELATLPAVSLKWPNDVYLEGRKICGILVEVPRNRTGRLLLGIGINVNNAVADAAVELQNTATSLCDVTGCRYPLSDVLVEVLKQLATRLQPADLWNAEVRAGWRQRCLLTGRRVQVDLGVRQTAGICRGIDEEGALLVAVDAGEVDATSATEKIVRCFAGVVTFEA